MIKIIFKNIVYIIKLAFILVMDFTVFFFVKSVKINENKLLLIRTDAIGDYIIFRNFIEKLKKSERYNNHEITLCGNIRWKDLAEKLDKNYISNFIWVDKTKFLTDLKYRYQILRKIKLNGYSDCIHPIYSREFLYGDIMVKFSNSTNRIGNYGDLSNQTRLQKFISDFYYTKLIDNKKVVIHEFERNKEFFEKLLNENINIKKPEIVLSEYNNADFFEKLNEYGNFIVIFPGAEANFRRWNEKNYAAISSYINNKFGFKIIIAGGPGDKKIAENIIRMAGNSNIIDLTGATNLYELCILLSKSKLLISNDTSAFHIGVAVNTKTICISNGNHFGRFPTYPENIDNIKVIYPPKIMDNFNEKNLLIEKYGNGSDLNINLININNVISIIDNFLIEGS
ncbi:MAG: glycosyltransferase family 9 protein [Candidatus Gracilibacteria bacterium]|nr:glycosyltransferase family 9 protein [Candidatus Gracilibacteria bacterium]